ARFQTCRDPSGSHLESATMAALDKVVQAEIADPTSRWRRSAIHLQPDCRNGRESGGRLLPSRRQSIDADLPVREAAVIATSCQFRFLTVPQVLERFATFLQRRDSCRSQRVIALRASAALGGGVGQLRLEESLGLQPIERNVN